MKNKYLSIIITALLLITALSGCSNSNTSSSDNDVIVSADDSLSIVCTIFPQYDWVTQILGDQANSTDMTLLLDNGVDLHNYQPTASDIVKISKADMFIYVGGESDSWVDDVLASANNKVMVVLNLMDILDDSVKEEEVIEGMEMESEHEHHHDNEDADVHEEDIIHDEDVDHNEDTEHHNEEAVLPTKDAAEHHEEDEIEYDEHVWLSLKNAETICLTIFDSLCTLDPDNKDTYESNYKDYIAQLTNLDGDYKKVVDEASYSTLLFGDRFPFRYLVDDYGLNYYAAFVGCSAETEASFETITFLANKVNELNLPAVLTIENSDQKIAKTVVSNTDKKDQKILIMDSLQSVTTNDLINGKTYLSVMKDNLSVLQEALN